MATVVRDGARIEYEVTGDGPPLVLLHGFYGDRSTWHHAGHVAALAPRFRLILIDLIGHGGSDAPHDPPRYLPGEQARDIVAILDAEGAGRAAVWGASRGGRIGLHLAAGFPERVTAMIVGAAHAEPTEIDRTGLDREVKLLQEQGTAPFAGTMEPDWMRQLVLGADGRALAAQLIADASGQPSPAGLDRVAVSMLFLVGDQDPRLEPVRATARRLARAQVAVLPGCGHFDALTRTDLTLPLVLDFLAAAAGRR